MVEKAERKEKLMQYRTSEIMKPLDKGYKEM